MCKKLKPKDELKIETTGDVGDWSNATTEEDFFKIPYVEPKDDTGLAEIVYD